MLACSQHRYHHLCGDGWVLAISEQNTTTSAPAHHSQSTDTIYSPQRVVAKACPSPHPLPTCAVSSPRPPRHRHPRHPLAPVVALLRRSRSRSRSHPCPQRTAVLLRGCWRWLHPRVGTLPSTCNRQVSHQRHIPSPPPPRLLGALVACHFDALFGTLHDCLAHRVVSLVKQSVVVVVLVPPPSHAHDLALSLPCSHQ